MMRADAAPKRRSGRWQFHEGIDDGNSQWQARPGGWAALASRHRPRLTIEQSSHVLFRESRANASVAIEQAISQSSLSGLEFIHFLLDRTGRHQAVDKNRLVLADAMRTINRLLLDSRIPPGIENNYRVGGGQVQPDPAGLQADQENLAGAVLKAFDRALAILGHSGQHAIANALRIEANPDQVDHGGELREHDDLSAFTQQLQHHFHQPLELGGGAFDAVSEFQERGIATSLAQPEQRLKHDDMALCQSPLRNGLAHLGRHRQAN